MKIKEAVIPAAGLGTRFLPTTKCVAKEMIPLVDRPSIQHVVEEAAAVGVEKIIFVISKEKEQVRSYFQENQSLYDHLERVGKSNTVESLRKLESSMQFEFVYQDAPLGLGHAVNCAREAVQGEYFYVILPDDIFVTDVPLCRQMANAFEEFQKPIVSVLLVNWEEVHRYGIVKADPLSDHVGAVQDIIEKPNREEAPSNLAVMGRYILPKSIFKILSSGKAGVGGEIQLTDSLRQLISKDGLYSYSFKGERLDTGTPLGWMKANLIMGVRSPQYRDELVETMKVILRSHS